ncbi:hypothetical protein [Curtobacterium sp. B8]|uniref:hypothetical protein n=1 Tax=Curtobacterium sp. B8 TaxID=95611 RepID=UPI0003B57647|nr:hypothetical protein [Curtobacterium sp. B8]
MIKALLQLVAVKPDVFFVIVTVTDSTPESERRWRSALSASWPFADAWQPDKSPQAVTTAPVYSSAFALLLPISYLLANLNRLHAM